MEGEGPQEMRARPEKNRLNHRRREKFHVGTVLKSTDWFAGAEDANQR